MFNTLSVLYNDQTIMRPIIKKPQSVPLEMNGFAAQSLSAQTIVTMDKATMFKPDNLEYKKAITTSFLLSPFMNCIMNMNMFTAHTRKSTHVPPKTTDIPHYEINERALRLDDIEPCWHATEKDVGILSMFGKTVHKEYDDVDLDLCAIQREAEKFNDCGELCQKLDVFFKRMLLEHVTEYIAITLPELTKDNRTCLYHISLKNEQLIFDQIACFGYDCLLWRNQSDFLDRVKYQNIVHKILGVSNMNLKQNYWDLSTDFGINFSNVKMVIEACDQYFEKSIRKRMPYTMQFCRIET